MIYILGSNQVWRGYEPPSYLVSHNLVVTVMTCSLYPPIHHLQDCHSAARAAHRTYQRSSEIPRDERHIESRMNGVISDAVDADLRTCGAMQRYAPHFYSSTLLRNTLIHR